MRKESIPVEALSKNAIRSREEGGDHGGRQQERLVGGVPW